MKKKLLISFSGGRTSAYMLWWILYNLSNEYEIKVVFANTGKEVEGTLKFVKLCSIFWHVPIVWVEAVPRQSKRGLWWGVDHKIVNFNTASRHGEPFEEMIKRLGIPSTNAPFCSSQLKSKAIKSYLKSIGWRKYYTAIGIREDEFERINLKHEKLRIIYPFITLFPVNKPMVFEWWSKQLFDLDIDPDKGNCDCCWKKDILRLVRISRKDKQSFQWWQDMTDTYGSLNPRNCNLKPPFNFYRSNLSPVDIHALSKHDDKDISKLAGKMKLDGCSESCEAF